MEWGRAGCRCGLSHTHSGFCRFGVFSYHAIFIGYYIASRKGHQGKALMKIMKRTIYKLAYGGRASITEYRDGRARLVVLRRLHPRGENL